MNANQAQYFTLYFTERITEFSKIDNYKDWSAGTAKSKYKKLDDFFIDELKLNDGELSNVKAYFASFTVKFNTYINKDRIAFFSDHEECLKWFASQQNRCGYCSITDDELKKVVAKRNGNLTLNNKQKRSKGTLEIEKTDPNLGYIYSNCILACPLCNNGKSNLIDAKTWRLKFAPVVYEYYQSILA